MKISLPFAATLVLLAIPLAITSEAGASEPVSPSESVSTPESAAQLERDSGLSEGVAQESLMTSPIDTAATAVSCDDIQGLACGPGPANVRCYDYQYCEWHMCLCGAGGTFNCEA